VQCSVSYKSLVANAAVYWLLTKKVQFAVEKCFLFFNAAFALAILDLICHVHLALFIIVLDKYIEISKFCKCFYLLRPVLWMFVFRLILF